MKSMKVFCRIVALVLIVSLLAAVPALAAYPKGSYYCNANRVHVRTGPSSAYASIYKLNKGDVVTYISRANGWYQVSFYDKSGDAVTTGYVYRKYLTSVSSSSSSSSTKSGATYKTTVNLRVRSQASVEKGYVKTKLKKGTKVKVSKQKGSWAYITYSGGTGWVSTKYLKRVN